MTKEELYGTLRDRFQEVLREENVGDSEVKIVCRALTPEEAIGQTKRKDYPILTGKDVMIEAQVNGARGQAFTDAPCLYGGTLQEILAMDIVNDAHARALFIAALNAVMASLGRCSGTVHCRTDGPERCAQDMLAFLEREYPDTERIALIGYQPALLEMLANSRYTVRVLDLNPDRIGKTSCGVHVEDGRSAGPEIIRDFAQLILCTGSTLSNGTIVDYLGIPVPVLFYGITAAGAAPLLGLHRVCFADRYEA